MEQAPKSEGTSSGTSALDDGLERQRFQELCDLLPVDVHWFDPITPQIVRDIVIAIEGREREACILAVEAEKLEASTDSEGDKAYDTAIEHAVRAIRMRSNAGHEGRQKA